MDCVSNYLYNDKAGIGLINMLVLARSQYYNVIFIQDMSTPVYQGDLWPFAEYSDVYITI